MQANDRPNSSAGTAGADPSQTEHPESVGNHREAPDWIKEELAHFGRQVDARVRELAHELIAPHLGGPAVRREAAIRFRERSRVLAVLHLLTEEARGRLSTAARSGNPAEQSRRFAAVETLEAAMAAIRDMGEPEPPAAAAPFAGQCEHGQPMGQRCWQCVAGGPTQVQCNGCGSWVAPGQLHACPDLVELCRPGAPT